MISTSQQDIQITTTGSLLGRPRSDRTITQNLRYVDKNTGLLFGLAFLKGVCHPYAVVN
jgi:hypothetical protein